jgi:chromosome segregation ATPase
MKLILPITLALACIALAVSFYLTKQGDNAQHVNDTGSIASFSNYLSEAQAQIAQNQETILTFSNSLDEAVSAFLMSSNNLLAAQSALALDAEQITNLNQQVAEVNSENQALSRRFTDATNQLADITTQIASIQASLVRTNADLVQARQDYLLLENRFRIDVGERTVVERKFNNPSELKAQMQKLKQNPAGVISEESIYAGLNVEVKSNGTFHVIAPN